MYTVFQRSLTLSLDRSELKQFELWANINNMLFWETETLLLLCSQLFISGVHHSGRDFLNVTIFFIIQLRGSHILSSWMVQAGSVFVAGIHLFRTWMSGSFEFVWWNVHVHRLDLNLYSHPKEFGGTESDPMLTTREKIPSIKGSEEDRIHDAASCRTASPTHYQLS